VDYFEAIAFLEWSRGPAVARDYVAIEFYGYAVGLHVEGFDQDRESERNIARCGGVGAFFAVDVQLHR
jgi:hypothetical protein